VGKTLANNKLPERANISARYCVLCAMEVTMHFAGYFSENNPVNSTSKENKEVAGSKAAIC